MGKKDWQDWLNHLKAEVETASASPSVSPSVSVSPSKEPPASDPPYSGTESMSISGSDENVECPATGGAHVWKAIDEGRHMCKRCHVIVDDESLNDGNTPAERRLRQKVRDLEARLARAERDAEARAERKRREREQAVLDEKGGERLILEIGQEDDDAGDD